MGESSKPASGGAPVPEFGPVASTSVASAPVALQVSVRPKLLRGTAVLTFGRLAGYGLSFLRNLLVARILSKGDYGLAAVFGTTVTLLEIGGRMAFGMQVIQAKEGDTSAFLASAHALQFAASGVSAVLIAAASVPVAQLFGAPQVWWAIALLAVVPISQGLSHLDIARRQRELDFLPLILVDVVPQAVITAAVWPLAVWLGDYRVMVALMIGKAVIGTTVTFLYARVPYRWAWDRHHTRGMLSFGWPLFVTSLVITAYQQADQVLVGAVFSLDQLANYALAFSLVSIPWLLISQVGGSLLVPVLARVQDHGVEFRNRYVASVECACVVAVTLMLPLLVLGEQMASLVYGSKYAGTGLTIALLGVAFVVRFLSFTPSYAALARGDTINQLHSNLGRSLSLPLALLAAGLGGGVSSIAASAIFGEVLSVVFSLRRLRQRQGVPYVDTARAAAYVLGFVLFALVLVHLGSPDWNVRFAALMLLPMLVLPLVVAWSTFPSINRFVVGMIVRHKRKTASPARSVTP